MNVDEIGRLLGQIQGSFTTPFGLTPEAAIGVALVAGGISAIVATFLGPKLTSPSGAAPAWVPRIPGLLAGAGGIGVGLLGIVLVS